LWLGVSRRECLPLCVLCLDVGEAAVSSTICVTCGDRDCPREFPENLPSEVVMSITRYSQITGKQSLHYSVSNNKNHPLLPTFLPSLPPSTASFNSTTARTQPTSQPSSTLHLQFVSQPQFEARASRRHSHKSWHQYITCPRTWTSAYLPKAHQ
jgi:hypothetical protein